MSGGLAVVHKNSFKCTGYDLGLFSSSEILSFVLISAVKVNDALTQINLNAVNFFLCAIKACTFCLRLGKKIDSSRH